MEENIVWRDVVGYEGHYIVSNQGEVISLKYGKRKVLKQTLSPRGYCRVRLRLNGTDKYVSNVGRLVAQAFPEICGEWFDGCTVDHINTIKTDNRAINLRVVTIAENISNPLTIAQRRGFRNDEEWREYQLERRKYFKKKDYIDNNDYYKNYRKKYYEEHKEYFKEYYKKNPPKYDEEKKQYLKEYYQKNKEKILEKQKRYRRKNKSHELNLGDIIKKVD